MYKFSFCFCSALLLSSSALATTCLNDYSGDGQGCAKISTAAGDCSTLGYSTEDDSSCTKWLYCPFDSSYKRCLKKANDGCDEINEFRVCLTTDTCIVYEGGLVFGGGPHTPGCYYCKRGYEYAKNMDAWKNNSTGEITTHGGISIINGQLSHNITKVEGGCKCIEGFGCEGYSHVTCPALSVCYEKCEDACGDELVKWNGCIDNAEPVGEGKEECQCIEGYVYKNKKCVNQEDYCAERKKMFDNAATRTYWAECLDYSTPQCSSNDMACTGYCVPGKDNSFCKNVTTKFGSYMDGCIKSLAGGLPSISDEYSDTKCPGTDACYATEAAVNKAIDKHNQECPNHQVTDRPQFNCNQYIPMNTGSGAPSAAGCQGYNRL